MLKLSFSASHNAFEVLKMSFSSSHNAIEMLKWSFSASHNANEMLKIVIVVVAYNRQNAIFTGS